MTQVKSQPQYSVEDLALFLNDNPDIFQQQPQLLENLNLSDGRDAPSLLERQIAALKAKLTKFQSQHFELINVARENEQISDAFSSIICRLIAYTNLSEFTSEFPKLLRNEFKIDEVTFKTPQMINHRPNETQAYEDALRRLLSNQATCDNRWPSNVLSIFFTNSIKSAALIPMNSGQESEILGVLALGSKNEQRYSNELGTAHLNRLGLMSGICLSRLKHD